MLAPITNCDKILQVIFFVVDPFIRELYDNFTQTQLADSRKDLQNFA